MLDVTRSNHADVDALPCTQTLSGLEPAAAKWHAQLSVLEPGVPAQRLHEAAFCDGVDRFACSRGSGLPLLPFHAVLPKKRCICTCTRFMNQNIISLRVDFAHDLGRPVLVLVVERLL